MFIFFSRIFSSLKLLLLFLQTPYLGMLIVLITIVTLVALISGKVYQHWDRDVDRGAIAITDGEFNESFTVPVYLDQGWTEAETLWFYNTTQGSALMPYDFFIALEQSGSQELFRSSKNIDKYRYLSQKPTFFNPDGLPVGFVKESYQGADYIGYTCAACHTAQLNYKGRAIRIDGGPAMANMPAFLDAIEKAMRDTLDDKSKQNRFIKKLIELDNDYGNSDKDEIIADLKEWTHILHLYNTVNHSHIEYGYARLDAFGRIYNRVIQHVINKPQLQQSMKRATSLTGERLLTDEQIDQVLEGIDDNGLVAKQFSQIWHRLVSTDDGYPSLQPKELLRLRNIIFNEPSAPVSYPFLWDTAQSDYLQWNGLANNAGAGSLARNAGQAIGVFAELDWAADTEVGVSFVDYFTGQKAKRYSMSFTSSVDVVNLQRLETQLKKLQSPVWPEDILGSIDRDKAERGQLIYAQYCQSCHNTIDRDHRHRVVIGKMVRLEDIGTDTAMAKNSVDYKGQSGYLKQMVQPVNAVGSAFIEEEAPVIQILSAVTRGVLTTPDADKWFLRRWLDRMYMMIMSLFQHDIPATIKTGNYSVDTTSAPYNSLLSYKARPLNGIWATAPYLHNGSVPSLYALLLPVEQRPQQFMVGSREFDPINVGLRSTGYDGFQQTTGRQGDKNTGHEYAAGRSRQLDGTILPPLNESQRWDLIEYLKTL